LEKRLVWDVPTRLFHWLIALSFCGSWFTAEAGLDWFDYHFYFGYTTLALLVFRLLWGFWGSEYARFRQFMVSPWNALRQIPTLLSRNAPHNLGHSGTGGWAVLILLSLLGIQVGSGLFVSDDIFYTGPYNPLVSSDTAGTLAYIHRTNFTVLQVFISLHLLVIGWYQFGKGENLTRVMLTGHKSVVAPSTGSSAETRWGLFIAATLVSIVAVTLLVQLAPEPVYLY
jgi:cytochrome b